MIKEKEKSTLDLIGPQGLAGLFLNINISLLMLVCRLLPGKLSKKRFQVTLYLAYLMLYGELLLFFYLKEFSFSYKVFVMSFVILMVICILGRNWIPYWEDD